MQQKKDLTLVKREESKLIKDLEVSIDCQTLHLLLCHNDLNEMLGGFISHAGFSPKSKLYETCII